jgi:phosphoenolpyruvate carboxylase
MNKNVLKQNFTDFVEKKFQFLNSVFLGLPLERDNRSTGKILVEFNEYVQIGIEQGRSPEDIILSFFRNNDEESVIASLYQIIKYIEREVVLFDAVEDASFEKINNLSGPNSLESVIGNALANEKGGDLMDCISGNNIRLVLTAHPTQFYPGTILGIINDLNIAVRGNDITRISSILEQLAYSPFFNKRKPTTYYEAMSLIWYLENVFYDAILNIQESVQNSLPDYTGERINPSLVEMGFWPGGDRDGNPFVTAEITLRVANRLRSSILNKYYEEIRALKRKLTFRGVYEKLKSIEISLLKSIYSEGSPEISADEFISALREICVTVKNNYKDRKSVV